MCCHPVLVRVGEHVELAGEVTQDLLDALLRRHPGVLVCHVVGQVAAQHFGIPRAHPVAELAHHLDRISHETSLAYRLYVDHTYRMTSGQRDDRARRLASAAVAERAESTRDALVAAARRLFVDQGYYETSTEEIVTLAGVGTRGALYHHFADKRALFVAVFEAVEQDLVAAAGAALEDGPPLAVLRAGLVGFLDASLSPEVQRVLLIDGPAVLGWQEWRAIEERYGLGGIQGMLELAVADGSLPPQPLEVLAHLLLAATDEAALFIVNAEDPAGARDQAVAAMDRLLSGLRAAD